jgi:hypothetical protein
MFLTDLIPPQYRIAAKIIAILAVAGGCYFAGWYHAHSAAAVAQEKQVIKYQTRVITETKLQQVTDTSAVTKLQKELYRLRTSNHDLQRQIQMAPAVTMQCINDKLPASFVLYYNSSLQITSGTTASPTNGTTGKSTSISKR